MKTKLLKKSRKEAKSRVLIEKEGGFLKVHWPTNHLYPFDYNHRNFNADKLDDAIVFMQNKRIEYILDKIQSLRDKEYNKQLEKL